MNVEPITKYSAAVPGEWMKTIFHTERNHYDRLVHFSFGLLLSYPQREILMRKTAAFAALGLMFCQFSLRWR